MNDRFVILHHQMPAEATRPTHWDLMLEQPEDLQTWALAREPAAGAVIQCELLPPHRKAYLDYQGPVRDNRGEVSQWERGHYQLLQQSEQEWVVALFGEKVQLTVQLERPVPQGSTAPLLYARFAIDAPLPQKRDA